MVIRLDLYEQRSLNAWTGNRSTLPQA